MIELIQGPYGFEIRLAIAIVATVLGLAPFAAWEQFKAWRVARVLADQRENPNEFPPMVDQPRPAPFGSVAAAAAGSKGLAAPGRRVAEEAFPHLTFARRQAD